MQKLFALKVELLDVEPLVWRRVLIPDDMPIYEMAAALVGAMGWNASHLLALEIDGRRYEMELNGETLLEDSLGMKGVIARDVLRPGVQAALHYDFGDDWWHRIEVVDHRPIAKGDKPPRCIGGDGACPPDDSGGPFGFMDMLDIVADPKHPDHNDLKDWLGDFDPAAFDPKKMDRHIKRVITAYRG